jgi:hypothetical protein
MNSLVVYEGHKLFFFDVLTAFLTDWEERNKDEELPQESKLWVQWIGEMIGIASPPSPKRKRRQKGVSGGKLQNLQTLGQQRSRNIDSQSPQPSSNYASTEIDTIDRLTFGESHAGSDPAHAHELMQVGSRADFENITHYSNLRDFFSQSPQTYSVIPPPPPPPPINERSCQSIDIISPTLSPVNTALTPVVKYGGGFFSFLDWAGDGRPNDEQEKGKTSMIYNT